MSVKSSPNPYWLRKSEEEIVSRAELKLAEAVKAFKFSFRDKVVLDIGSSTGGFTEFALKEGAKKVIAVEKGTNQMKVPLRLNPKIELHEKTDFLALKNKEIQVPEVILADVSFISLTKILAYAKVQIASSETDYLVMFKPQFEADKEQLVHGVVKNETIRREIIKNFENWLRRKGFLVVQKHDNEIKGKSGNRERFYWLRNPIH